MRAKLEFAEGCNRGAQPKLLIALQGTLTIFEDIESLTPVLSYNLAVCSLIAEESKLFLRRTEKLYKHKV